MNDLVVVGGGLAGLAAATWCARRGLRVALLERAGALGGRARTDLHAGYAHNLGAHALYVGGAAARGLGDLGVSFTGRPPPTGGLLAIAHGEVHRFPSGLFSMLATDLFTFGAKIEAARALATLVRTDPRPLRDVPWATWLEGVAPRAEVRAAIASIARVTTYANASGRSSAGATIEQVRRGASPGVLYLDDGWQSLVDGLERAARDAGVRIVRSAPVASVIHDGQVRGVAIANGETVAGRSVLLATGPSTARALTGKKDLGGNLVPVHVACLDLGLADLPRPDRLAAFGVDEPTYFSVHSASARLAARGATVHVMKYIDPDSQGDADPEAELERVMDRVQPGWRAQVVVRRFLPSLVASNALVEVRKRRPGVDAVGIERVYLAGDWVGEESMLADAAIASARAAATRIVADLTEPRARTGATGTTMAAS
jgi:phytoene dehydrogenase-like protein